MRLFAFHPIRVFLVVFLVATSVIIGYGRATRGAGRPDMPPSPARVETEPLKEPVSRESPADTSEEPPPEPPATHQVRQGETLFAIAARYGLSVAELQAANDIAGDRIRDGQILNLPKPGTVGARRMHTVQSGESLWEIANRYGVTLEEMGTANGLVDPGYLQIGQQLALPEAAVLKPDQVGDEHIAYGGLFQWPVVAPVSSYYGPRWGRNHAGIDLAANQGTPIRAARDGKVALSGSIKGYGNTVILDHPDGSRTLYAHCERLLVKQGQQVKQGQTIATVGSTGHSTGPHLHFEIHVASKTRNPLDYLPKR